MRKIVGITGPPCGGKSHFTNLILNMVSEVGESLPELSRQTIQVLKSGSVAASLADDNEGRLLTAGVMFPNEDRLAHAMAAALQQWEDGGLILDGWPRFGPQVERLLEWAGMRGEARVVVLSPRPIEMMARESRRNAIFDHGLMAKRALWYGRQIHEVLEECLRRHVDFWIVTEQTEPMSAIALARWLSEPGKE